MIIKNSDEKVYANKCEILNLFKLTTENNEKYTTNPQTASRENVDSKRRMIWFMPYNGKNGWINKIKNNKIFEDCIEGTDKFKSRMDMQERIVFTSIDGNHNLKFLGVYKSVELIGSLRTFELVDDEYEIK